MGSLRKQNGLTEPSHCSHDPALVAKGSSATVPPNPSRSPGQFISPRVFILFPNNNECGTPTSEGKGRTDIYWDPTVCLALTECTHCLGWGLFLSFICSKSQTGNLGIAWPSPFFAHSQQLLRTSCPFRLQIHLHWIPPFLNHRCLILQSAALMTPSPKWPRDSQPLLSSCSLILFLSILQSYTIFFLSSCLPDRLSTAGRPTLCLTPRAQHTCPAQVNGRRKF